MCWYMCLNHVCKCQRPSEYDWWRDRDEKLAWGCVDPWTKTNIRQDITQLLNVVLNWAEAWLHEHTLKYASSGALLWMKVSDFIISRRGEKREFNLEPVEVLVKIKENGYKIRGQGKDKQRLEWSAAYLNVFLTLSRWPRSTLKRKRSRAISSSEWLTQKMRFTHDRFILVLCSLLTSNLTFLVFSHKLLLLVLFVNSLWLLTSEMWDYAIDVLTAVCVTFCWVSFWSAIILHSFVF